MSVRRSLISLAVLLLVAGCSDNIGPPRADQPLSQAPHFLKWAGPSAPQFSAIDARSGLGVAHGEDGVFAGSTTDDELGLVENTVTFWAVRGQERSVQINYRSGSDTPYPFLRLTTFDPTYVPGLGDLAEGDSVLITVTVDPAKIKVSLEPTGLQFGTPSQLYIGYGGAAGDMNGDGVVDDADAGIESHLLGMWYREGTVSAWTRITAAQSLDDKSFSSELQHFCDYAVSW